MPEPKTRLTAAQYLEIERASDVKHELVAGEMFAMSGVTRDHARIALNLVVALDRILRGGPTEVFASGLKVRIEASNAYLYPDVVVACDVGEEPDPYVLRAPVLVAEVLSPSTAAYDRGEKLAFYAYAVDTDVPHHRHAVALCARPLADR